MWWARLLNTISGLLGAAGAAVVGDYESIATTVVGSGGATISFTSIPSTFKHLQLRAIARGADSGSSRLEMRVNSDSGSNYAFHYMYGNGSSTFADAYANQPQMLFNRISGAGSLANVFGAQIMDILDYANTNKFKTFRALTAFDENGSGEMQVNSGLWRSTSAINAISITAEGGANLAQYSHFALYGIKG
jgi:hypothetical protein